jgi:predicted amidophosphoribosyltransferase
LLCEHCRQPVDNSRATSPNAPTAPPGTICVACKKTFDATYRYCPLCGQRARP